MGTTEHDLENANKQAATDAVLRGVKRSRKRQKLHQNGHREQVPMDLFVDAKTIEEHFRVTDDRNR